MAIIACIFISGCTKDASKPRNRKPIDLSQRTAPDFTAQTIDGKTITLSDYQGSKAVIVDIWATWCGPCQMEMPLLQKIYEKHRDKLEIIAVSVDERGDTGKVMKFVTDKNIKFKIIHDLTGDIARKFPTRSIPFLTVIDKDGKVVKTFLGLNMNLQSEIESTLGL